MTLPFRGPLHGIRVIDASRILAGPSCSQNLSDLGAEIIKIERVNVGDDTRWWGPPFVQGESTYFMGVNRNKKSLAIDLKTAKGIDIIHRLVSKSDVFLENFVPKTAERLGLGYTQLRKRNPRLVYASISGYGQTGPDANKPAYDVIISAIGGLMGVTGEDRGGPVKCGVALTDILTGLHTSNAICAALYDRERTGAGSYIECSLLDTQVASLANVASAYLLAGVHGKRWGSSHASIVPYRCFQCIDGYIAVGAMNEGQWNRLLNALDSHEKENGERMTKKGREKESDSVIFTLRSKEFDSNEKRVMEREKVDSLLSSLFERETSTYWRHLLDSFGIPNGPVNSIEEVFEEEQVKTRGIVKEVTHSVGERMKFVGSPIYLHRKRVGDEVSETDENGIESESEKESECGLGMSVRSAPPLLGEHTESVLFELGLCKDEIEELKRDKVIQTRREHNKG